MAIALSTGTIEAQNSYSNWVTLDQDADLSISGVTDSTVTLQRSLDGGVTARDVESFTADVEKILSPTQQSQVVYRAGVKTGDYGANNDTILIEISR